MMRRILNWFTQKPDLYATPDQTNTGMWSGISDSFIDVHLNVNTELPRIGDVVAELESCGMGMSVRRDTRYRVVDRGPYPTSVIGETADGKLEILHNHYMRRHSSIARFWWKFS